MVPIRGSMTVASMMSWASMTMLLMTGRNALAPRHYTVMEPPGPPGPPGPAGVAGAAGPAGADARWPAGADILFETDEATVDEAAAEMVRKVVEFAKANGNVAIRLDGHADPRGTEPHDMELSKKRVDAVRQALVDAGVSADRIEVASFGEARSKCAEQDEGGLTAARRVAVFFTAPSDTSAASIRTDGKPETKKERSK